MGVPLFPLLRLCTCLSVIDQFGNHALLQDHRGVFREQGIASDQSRPGDIYHPDFALGCPAYLTSPLGAQLSLHGDDFIPLVCETFGVWSPFALSTLFTIADRTTVN